MGEVVPVERSVLDGVWDHPVELLAFGGSSHTIKITTSGWANIEPVGSGYSDFACVGLASRGQVNGFAKVNP